MQTKEVNHLHPVLNAKSCRGGFESPWGHHYTPTMKFNFLLIAILSSLLVGCSNQSNQESDKAVEYKKCLEDETGKLLDETASNFEYARGEATKICAPLDPTASP